MKTILTRQISLFETLHNSVFFFSLTAALTQKGGRHSEELPQVYLVPVNVLLVLST